MKYLTTGLQIVGTQEINNLHKVIDNKCFVAGKFCDEFEEKLPKHFGLDKSLFVNSGSSANLLSVAALTSHKLKDMAIKSGDEVILCAAGFPTTAAPAIQYGMKPVFIDVEIDTINPIADIILEAVTPKTKLVMIAHSLGVPFRADLIRDKLKEKGIWLIEDCCDAFGAKINGKSVGTFGDLATCSFYPAHHITTGEGGSVMMNDSNLYKIVRSFRDWGRDCWCPPNKNNTCGTRFNYKMGDLPKGYDHKYIYSHLGYNLKNTDFAAAIGLAQLEKVNEFIAIRQRNHSILYDNLILLGAQNEYILPRIEDDVEASPFGFVLTYKGNKKTRKDIVTFLEINGIATRMIFGGNLIAQPAFKNIDYRIYGNLDNTNYIMERSFWVGCHPGLTSDDMSYMAYKIMEALN